MGISGVLCISVGSLLLGVGSYLLFSVLGKAFFVSERLAWPKMEGDLVRTTDGKWITTAALAVPPTVIPWARIRF